MADRYEWDRDRDRDRDIEREREGYRGEWGRGRENRNFGAQGSHNPEGNWNREREGWNRVGREEWQRNQGERFRNEPGRYTETGEQGDWGRQGSWGSFGNRSDYGHEGNWSDVGRDRDFYRRREEQGQVGRGGAYQGGMGSFGGGMSQYGERGRFAGRGPKNWQRSDDRIREDISERLSDHPYIDAGEIEVNVKSGEVTLTGSVYDRNMKRMAEELAENVSGVKDVHNQIRVQQGQEHALQSTSTTTGGTNKKS